ncbi:hypothetical protein R3P38DRAFT_3236828 [Favolaschia claudopus]|uniref:Uncharacterized protein n=1 Tax=Favolaschia claudopus TaxID=2862362 RepID=A0AAV9ZC16_9AGAR
MLNKTTDSSAAPETYSSRRTYQLPDAILAGLDLTRPNQPFLLSTTTFPPLRLQKIPFRRSPHPPVNSLVVAVVTAAPAPLRRHDVSPSRERRFWSDAAGRQIPALTRKAAGPAVIPRRLRCCRDGAITLTRRIHVPRAGFLVRAFGCRLAKTALKSQRDEFEDLRAALYLRDDVSSSGERAFWILSLRQVFPDVAVPTFGTSMTICIDVLRGAMASVSLYHLKSCIASTSSSTPPFRNSTFRRPLSDVSKRFAGSKFSRCAAFIIDTAVTAARHQNSILGLPPSNASGIHSKIFLPAARASSSLPPTPERKFEISPSAERRVEIFGIQMIFSSRCAVHFIVIAADTADLKV